MNARSETARNNATDLIREARACRDPRQRVELARKALVLSSDCADAYTILARDDARDRREAERLLIEGLKAGERHLRDSCPDLEPGRYWEEPEARPYMRARHGLAECLWVEGRHEEAIDHYREMLRLNPADDQGIRYLLAGGLMELGRDEEAEALLGAYVRDECAEWLYTLALIAFRKEGDSPRSEAMLARSLEANLHVPDYLLARKEPPAEAPEFIAAGDEDEAAAYAIRYRDLWRKTPGALEWLASRQDRASHP
jgi:tetratricopeptide (TPR) repeat protein